MGTQVTVTLPDPVYRQVQAAARRARRPVSAVLADALTQAFPAFSVSPDRERMEREQEAYERLHGSLLETHEGQYVAIHGGQLVDADADEVALARRIIAAYANEVVHIRKVRREPEPELRIRSPRFID